MELYSVSFGLFLVTALITHELIRKMNGERQWLVKLIASLFFYVYLAKWRVIFVVISAFSIWFCAGRMEKISLAGENRREAEGLSKEDKKKIKKQTFRKKRLVLLGAIVINLGLLILVKYVMPAISTSIIFPLGISYYTFMAISYLVDIYGEKYEHESNIFKLTLYLIWFPQIFEGPINRFDYVKNGLYGNSRITYDNAKSCALLFLFGAIKKYSLANVLAPCVNEIFMRGDISDLPGSFLLFTAFLFAIEQYADFSGGIDMVMAVSGLFGVKMNDNFRQPYFSKSISEFWRRWHISLGSFLRDYVFYPFALLPPVMKLNDKLSRRFNKHIGRSVVAGIGNILVFLLVGLWHGSALHYVVWGLYNGIIIVISDLLSPVFTKAKDGLNIKKDNKIFATFQIARTFFLIVLAGYFDALPDVSNGLVCFKNTFTSFRVSELPLWLKYLYDCKLISDIGIIVAISAFIIVLIFSLYKENKKDLLQCLSKRFIVVRWAVYFVLIYVLLFGFASASGDGGFMYAAF